MIDVYQAVARPKRSEMKYLTINATLTFLAVLPISLASSDLDSSSLLSMDVSFNKSRMHPYDYWYTKQLENEPATDNDDMMNYGLHSDPLHPCVAMTKGDNHPLAHMANMYSALIQHGFGVGIDLLRGKRVLEVGSGRGGGAAVLSKCHCPDLYLGVDFNKNQIEGSQRRLTSPESDSCKLAFQQGDAMDLHNVQDSDFDIVVNMESSHCYPKFEAFVKEVYRVLKPGGIFLLGDFREDSWPEGDEFKFMTEILKRSFRHLHALDVTKNVSHSIQQRTDALQIRYEKCCQFAQKDDCAAYWGTEGSFSFAKGYAEGNFSFIMWSMTKEQRLQTPDL